MEIRKIDRADVANAVSLYARSMAETEYFKSAYMLERDEDRHKLIAALAMDHGPVLSRVFAYGTSLGAWNAGQLIGVCACFWYKVVRQYDVGLFDAMFRDGSGNLPHDEDLHSVAAGLRGAVLYGLSLCVAPDKRRERVATRLVDTAIMRLKPDWLVGDVSASESLPIYERLGGRTHRLDEGYTLCVVKCP